MSEPAENLIYDFLEEAISNAQTGESLFEVELHDTLFKKIEKESGIRVGDGESDLSPNQHDSMQEYDAEVTIVIYSKILGVDKTERRTARNKAFGIAKAVVKLFKDSPSMNARVCDSLVLTAFRGWDSINSNPYAVFNIPIIINPTGQYNFNTRRRG